MKKLSLLLVAFALLTGLSQCRKPKLPVLNGETQYIVLSANNGNNGSKVEVDFSTVSTVMGLTWEETDKIAVSGGAEGTLKLKEGAGTLSATFEGPIVKTTGGEVVFTYGNELTYTGQTGTKECIKSLIRLEGESEYASDGKYSVNMTMPYAVLKLDLSGFGTAEGTTVTINELGSGTVASVNGVKNDKASKALYVAVPAPNAFGTSEGGLVSRKYEFESSVGVASCEWPLVKNTFYTLKDGAGAAIVVTPTSNPKLLPGKFSVSATDYVQFSRGNLQFKAGDGYVASPEWQFAEHQYDVIGKADGNTTSTGRDIQAAWIDLFGWGATGRNSFGQQPYSISTTDADYKTVATAAATETLTHDNGGDWGVCMGEDWFTLSKSEMEWLLGVNNGANPGINCRMSSTVSGQVNARYVRCKVNSINGLIIFPDEFTWPTGEGAPAQPSKAYINDNNLGWSSVPSYSLQQFEKLELAGVAFLPAAAGYRNGATVNNEGEASYYWLSTASSDVYAYFLRINNENTSPAYGDGSYRHYGRSVRLVQKFEKPHDAVFIGGVYWATENIGATTPKDNGWYFSWGNTTGYIRNGGAWASVKDGTGWPNYENTKGHDLSGNIPESVEYDAARANWGGNWRMPKQEDFAALCDACTGGPDKDTFYFLKTLSSSTPVGGVYWLPAGQSYLSDYSGVAGVLFVDKTDSSKQVFFPAAGYRKSAGLEDSGITGMCWSSSSKSSSEAYSLLFITNSYADSKAGYDRFYGYTIRPVHD